MTQDGATQPSRRLAAIMFTDLVGYSALAHRDEALAIELLELHRGWVREILPKHGGIEVETVGDAFLVEFAGALAAVECAMAIQQRFAEHNESAPEGRRMQLRIGIHLGDIEHKDGKVMGDGVNIASRIHGMAEAGGICVSETVFLAVRHRAPASFESIGVPELKNIPTPLELYRVVPGARAAKGRGRPGRGWKRPAFALAVGAMLLGTALAGYRWFGRSPPERSIAVLPFANLSAEQGSEYFADGVHDSVITHLARIKDLKTISRTSVMEYQGARRNLRDIGRALGVAHVVEGTVQRVGGRIRINAQLIDTRSDAHVWARDFDRELADVFSVQAEIAQQIAQAVEGTLTPIVRGQIEKKPTANLEAYDLYLRARKAEDSEVNDVKSAQRIAFDALERAIALDPGFALAHARMATTELWIYASGVDPDPARLERAKASVDTALALDPELAEAQAALAGYFHTALNDYERARREYERSLELAPGNANALVGLGDQLRHLGRLDEALRHYQRNSELDPRSEGAARGFINALWDLGRYAEAATELDRLLTFTKQPFLERVRRAGLEFDWKGDLSALERVMHEQRPRGSAGDCARCAWELYMLKRDYKRAAEEMIASAVDPAGSMGQQPPVEHYIGYARLLDGNREEALKNFEIVARRLAPLIASHPEFAMSRAWHSNALAVLGRRTEALAEAERALSDMPLERDYSQGLLVLGPVMRTHILTGETQRALDELGILLATPGGMEPRRAEIDPRLDPLRADPRFKKLIAEHWRRG